jgi:hypothetical protein
VCAFLDDAERDHGIGSRDCVRIGTPGSAQSVVVRHVNAERIAMAFSKVAASERSLQTLANEIAVLNALDGRRAPRLLCAQVDPASAFAALTTQALDGTHLRISDGCPDDLEECLPCSGECVALANHPWMVDRRWGGEDELALRGARIAERYPAWPVCTSHGDAAPWNAVRTRSGVLQLFDWEYATERGLWLFDRAYWVVQTGRLVRRRSASACAAECAGHLGARYPEVARAAAGLVSLVALAVAVRWSESERAIVGANATWWRECCEAALRLGEE